jgi:hypothetical protein
MLYIRIKENTQQAKLFAQYVKTLPFVEVVEKEKSKKKPLAGASPYDKDFVREVQVSRKSKGTPIRTADLWK